MNKGWALILGASSGFGAAAARALASEGYDIFGVHMDRRSALPQVEALISELESAGRRTLFFNTNAADPKRRDAALEEMQDALEGEEEVRVLMHSLAFGTLGAYVGEGAVNPRQMDMTLRVMAHSLVDWTRAIVEREMMGKGGRIFAMTSSGSSRAIPRYGAVGAAKAALEAHCRQLAAELAPAGITVNALRGGVTDTPALRKIPGNERLIEGAEARNPSGRLTRPEDVANALVTLARPEAYWITGNVINVDGGEEIVG